MSARSGNLVPVRAMSGMARVTALQAAALLPPVGVAIAERGPVVVPVLVTVVLVTLVWEIAFSLGRALPLSWHGLVTALILTVILPPSLPVWQIVLATSFGIVLGDQIFGGRGFGFLSSSVVAGMFLTFSFPGTVLAGSETAIAWATLPGFALLFATGLLPWRVLAGTVVAIAVGFLSDGAKPEPQAFVALAFGAVFLIADPMATAVTNAGRWLSGALAGLLALHFGAATGTDANMGAVVSAALISSLVAPVIDHAAILAHARRRRRRQSRA